MTAKPTAPAKLTKAGLRILESSAQPGGHPIRDQRELRVASRLKSEGYVTLSWSPSSKTYVGDATATAAGLTKLESEKGKRA